MLEIVTDLAHLTHIDYNGFMGLSRSEHFELLKNHAWLGRSFAKLTAADLQLARKFLADNSQLSKDEFVQAAVRMFLDQPSKTKRWKEIEELLVCANSSLK